MATSYRLIFAAAAVVSCSVSFDVGPRPLDGGLDGGLEGGGRTCTAEFCADFESGAVDSGWTERREEGGASVALDETRGFESSRSAAFRLNGDKGSSIAALQKAFDGVRPFVTELDVWVPTPDWRGIVNFAIFHASVGSGDSASTAYFALVVAPENVALSVQAPDLTEAVWNNRFPYDRWVHVAIDIDWGSRSAKVRLDGNEILSKSFTPTIDIGSDRPTEVRVGAFGFNPPSPVITVNSDNVMVSRR